MNYWKKQTTNPIYSDIDQEKPEQKQHAGRLLIIGGHSGAFFTTATATAKATELGLGKVRTILPDTLKSRIPTTTPETIFAPSAPSGGFSKSALPHLLAAADQADYIIIIGDLGKNAETATAITEFLKTNQKPTLITRDTIDLVITDATTWIVKPNIAIFATLPQLQKLFRTAYYPKVITLSMPLNQLVETLHKFTLSYPSTILTHHQGQVILASQGDLVTTDLKNTPYTPITLWSGDLAIRIAQLALWNLSKDLIAIISTAIVRTPVSPQAKHP